MSFELGKLTLPKNNPPTFLYLDLKAEVSSSKYMVTPNFDNSETLFSALFIQFLCSKSRILFYEEMIYRYGRLFPASFKKIGDKKFSSQNFGKGYPLGDILMKIFCLQMFSNSQWTISRTQGSILYKIKFSIYYLKIKENRKNSIFYVIIKKYLVICFVVYTPFI